MEPISVSDIFLVVLLGILVFWVSFYCERKSLQGAMPQYLSRKIQHVVGVGSCTIAGGIIQNPYFLIILVGATLIPLIYFVYYRDYFNYNGKRNWGLIYFPVVFMILLWLFPHNRFLVVAPMGLLALADAAATIFGERFSRSFFTLTGDKKSVIGTSSFILISFGWFFIMGCFGYGKGQSWTEYLVMAFAISTFTAATEALGSDGRDNIWVPATSAFLLWSVYYAPVPVNPYLLATAIFVVIPGIYVVYRLGLLTTSGGVAASLLGISIWIIGGFPLWPILVFFITGSALGKLPGKKASDPKASKPRDSQQVFANGFAAWLISMLNVVSPDEKFYYIYLVACAVACADTWATEIGTRWGGIPRDIVTFRKIPAGVSGGISLVGLAGMIAGAGVISLFAGNLPNGIAVGLLGIMGAGLDSFLGATIQARYVNEHGEMTDKPTITRINGWVYISNDLVNLLSILFTVSLSFLIL